MRQIQFDQNPKEPLPGKGKINSLSNPIFLILTTAVAIFISEVLVMILLGYLPPLTSYQEALLDGALLSIIVFPTLYFFVFRPLRLHIDQRQRAEAQKDTMITELQKALDEVSTLQGIIPICASCKNIRDDEGFWHQVEAYVSSHSNALFSHGICPKCTKKLYPEYSKQDSS